MYCTELPACSIKQVAKMRDRAFLSVMESQHLLVRVRGRKKSYVIITVLITVCFLTKMSVR